MKDVRIKVNGEWIEDEVKPETTLLRFLRDNNFTEVKKGCDRGDCGSCTVILEGKAITSCTTLALQADGKKVETVRSEDDGLLKELKDAFVEYEAIQCGFCTPGMLMTSRWLLDRNPNPSRDEIREALSGNICRCTGYKKIVDAVEAASEAIK